MCYTVWPCGGTQPVKAADCGFTYTVRLSPSPVWQLSGTSIKFHANTKNKKHLLPVSALKIKVFATTAFLHMDFKVKYLESMSVNNNNNNNKYISDSKELDERNWPK